MKRSWKIAIAVAGLVVIGLVAGGAALASGHFHEGFVKRRVTRHIDAALDAVGADAAQRNAVHAARDHVFATLDESHQTQKADIAAVLTLWESDRLDAAQIAALRGRHQATAKKTGDAVVQALSDAHDALTAAQRQKLADFLRAHKPPKMDGAKPFFRHMVDERVDDMLDEIKARSDQRDKVHAAVERAFAAISGEMGSHQADFDQAIAVFTADQIDAAQVAALQAARQARLQKIGDTVVQSISEIHDALDAGQRKQVADFVRSHHHGG
jgi:periplasmic protein CpxP/Spy